MKHCVPFLVMGLLLAASAAAHHSWSSNYRGNDPEVEISGVITQLEWKNPHVRMQVTVDAGKPTAQVWDIESASVAQLSRMDVTPNLVRVGQAVKVAGYGGVTNQKSLFMNHLLLPDNREVIFTVDGKPRWSGEHVGDAAKLAGTVTEPDINKRPASIFAVWTTVYGDPESHAASAQKVAAQKAAASNAGAASGGRATPARTGSAVLPSSASYCAPKAMPLAMGNPYPIQFVKSGADVLLKLEENDQVRVIHISNTHDDSRATRSGLGYSTGVWVGSGEKKLVVTTTKIDNRTLGDQARMTETFELSTDRNRLQYTATTVDPARSSAPTTTSKYWQYRPGLTLERYDCTL